MRYTVSDRVEHSVWRSAWRGPTRRVFSLAALLCAFGAQSATAATTLTPVSGSPFAAGGDPYSLAFNPSGGLLAAADTGGGGDFGVPQGGPGAGALAVFSVSPAGMLAPIGPALPANSNPTSVAFSPNGALLVLTNTSGPGSLSVFSVSAAGALAQVGAPVPMEGPTAVAFSPNGALLAVATNFPETIAMFSVSPGGTLTPVGAPFATGDRPNSVAFSPGGRLLATAIGSGVSTFSVSPGGALTPVGSSTTGGQTESVSFSPDGALLATVVGSRVILGSNVMVFSVSAGGTLTQAGSALGASENPTGAVAFSPRGGLLAATSPNTASLFAVSASGSPTLVATGPPTHGSPSDVAFSPDGRLLAVSSQEGVVAVFSVPTTFPPSTSPGPSPSACSGQIAGALQSCKARRLYNSTLAKCTSLNTKTSAGRKRETACVANATIVYKRAIARAKCQSIKSSQARATCLARARKIKK